MGGKERQEGTERELYDLGDSEPSSVLGALGSEAAAVVGADEAEEVAAEGEVVA